ncbi:unnamed protein product [Laminaria digitata]
MRCQRPSVESSVYPNFDPASHVVETPARAPTSRGVCATRPPGSPPETSDTVGGMDFGLRSPHVMLWARVHGRGLGAHVHIIDEYIVEGLTLDRHLQAIDQQRRQRGWPGASQLAWVGVDPAGHQRNAHSGRTDIALLRDAGYRVRSARTRLAEGIEIVRRRLDRGTLTLHPRCVHLIRAMQAYRFAPGTALHPYPDQPLKDGPDHACDALRYLLLNLERAAGPVRTTSYL